MASYILCDCSPETLLPFTYTRPMSDCRVGILTIREKWEHYLRVTTSSLTTSYLAEKFPVQPGPDNYWINGSLLPDLSLVEALHELQPGERLTSGEHWLMSRLPDQDAFVANKDKKAKTYKGSIRLICHPWELFHENDQAIRDDFLLLTRGRKSQPLPKHVQSIGKDIFLEEGAEILPCTLNSTTGPIYIGSKALLMEGALVRGPFAIGEEAVLKMGAKVYGATTIGPGCTAGGEIKNCIFFGYSNKAHDGYLGDAVIGEWCNLGAGTSCSNLKNNAGDVQVWNIGGNSWSTIGKKCGILMGDFSRSGIQTMFNTGTVIGISCNIYGAGFPSKYIPSFTWGLGEKPPNYDLDRAIRDAEGWMALKGKNMDDFTKKIIRHLYSMQSNN